MKKPKGLESISFNSENISLGPYPPLGFAPVYEAELGNGDYYGIYWFIGREESEPIICDMIHDEGRIIPCFSSLEKFIEWLELNNWERGDEEVEDNQFFLSLFSKAKAHTENNDLHVAIELVRSACSQSPEISEYWFSLYSLLRRTGKIEESARAALKAFNSSWVFGLPAEGALRAIKHPQIGEILTDDPIIHRIKDISLAFGGVKQNPIYPIILECVNDYLRNKKYVDGLILFQNYAYMMTSETRSFQERYQPCRVGRDPRCLFYARKLRGFRHIVANPPYNFPLLLYGVK